MAEDRDIRNRIDENRKSVNASFFGIADSVSSHGHGFADIEGRAHSGRNAIGEILAYYDIRYQGDAVYTNDVDEQLDRTLRTAGYMRRKVSLKGKWWRDCKGAMLCETTDGDTVALIPKRFQGYTYYDYSEGKRVSVDNQTSKKLTGNALSFYRPLPQCNGKMWTLIRFIRDIIPTEDAALLVFVALLMSLLSLFVPFLNRYIFSTALSAGDMLLVVTAAIFLLSVSGAKAILSNVKGMLKSRVFFHTEHTFEGAVMAKLVNMPASFFSKHSSGELTKMVDNLNEIPSSFLSSMFDSGLTFLFSSVFVFQIFCFTPTLVAPAIFILLLLLTLSVACICVSQSVQAKKLVVSSAIYQFAYSIFSGVQKVKVTGGEDRAFSKWANLYKQQAKLEYMPPLVLRLTKALMSLISLSGILLLYVSAHRTGVSSADFIAFSSAYGLMTEAMLSLVGMAETLASMRPAFKQAEDFLTTPLPLSENKAFVDKIDGKIEVNNVTFTYSGQSQKILDNISFSIEKGQYVAIVGRTGCGKSTLLRMLLGFDTPQSGAVYIDGKDIKNLDMSSFRSHIGAVLQNSRLFSGDILSNITIANPDATEDDVWQALETAGIADDIKKMPMGLYTHVSEGAGTISGGQKQRIMIARALISKPSLLILDEAMGALDYQTQKHVSQRIEQLDCTRIIIAHRLSTIRWCDKILVLDKGRIAEEGTFDELERMGGIFASLIKKEA